MFSANNGIRSALKMPYTPKTARCNPDCLNPTAVCPAQSGASTGEDTTAGDEFRVTKEVGVVQPKDFDDFILTLEAVGPLSVCADVTDKSFGYYKSGIFNPASARDANGNPLPYHTDHCMSAVGYGYDAAGKPYAIVRNSWGADWGNKGTCTHTTNNTSNTNSRTRTTTTSCTHLSRSHSVHSNRLLVFHCARLLITAGARATACWCCYCCWCFC